MIECRNLSRKYANKFAVKDINLRINSGEFVVLVGPSGCGKSTSLKMINRLIEPDQGELLIDGKNIQQMPISELRRRIGYVIQSTGLFPHWRVAENIATVPKLIGWPRVRIKQQVKQLMCNLGLTPVEQFYHKYPHELSGGQAQRVGVARALAADPQILLMDEPFGALDPITREVLQKEVRRIQQQTKKTILFVTHDMDEALVMADKIAIMKAGELVQYAAPIDLLINPASDFVREFIGQSDLGLKLLSQRHVSQYVHAIASTEKQPHNWILDADNRPHALVGGKLSCDQRTEKTKVNTEWLATMDMSMKEALSRMVWYRVSVLPVVNDKGLMIGEVSLQAMMQPPIHHQ